MYPDLSYILHDLIGTDRDNGFAIIKTFGLFLGLTFLVAGYVLYLDFKRKEKLGLLYPYSRKETVGAGPKWSDVITNALIGFFVGFKLPYVIQHFDEFKADGAGVIFSSKGNLLLGIIGLVGFAGYVYWQGIKDKLPKPKIVKETIYPHQKVGDIIIMAALSGIVGARVFSILENLDSFVRDPFGQLLSGSGLTIYGGLIFGFAFVFYYVRKIGIKPIYVMDSAALALMVGYAVGRMGCQLSGDGDWGIVNNAPKPSWFVFPDWAWAYSYPHNVLQEGERIVNCVGQYCTKLSPPVFPTPVYEIVVCLIFFVVLWFLRNRIKVPGVLFFIFCIMMGIERFLVEFIRINPRYAYLGLDWSQAQYISIALIIVGIVAIIYLYRRHSPDAVTA